MTDRNKIPAFSKLPWMLALAPCTDFLIHLDADAMFANLDLPLDPWLQFMETKGLDQVGPRHEGLRISDISLHC